MGLGRFGASIAQSLRERGSRLLAVDFDSEAVRRHTRDGYAVHYGDIEDPEFIASLPLKHAQWVVSTVRDRSINQMLLHGLWQQGYQGKVALSTSSRQEAQMFEKKGVDMVSIPYADAATEAAERLIQSKKPAPNR